jgi:polysaccharide chain length determinant protein (PEP-CTERM system associated)
MEVREYGKLFVRRKWQAVFTVLFILFAASVYCVITPDLYKSSITILVIPQPSPQDVVRSAAGLQVEQQLDTIKQQVTSRTMLTKVMDDLRLFEKERRKGTSEALFAKMRKRIEIEVVRGPSRERSEAFSLSFLYESPKEAMNAAARLASLFIDESLLTREHQSVGISEFLESQLRGTKARLEVMEQRVKDYKMRHMGELPQQMEANLRMLAGLQDRLRTNETSTRSVEERKVFLETQINLIGSSLSHASAGSGRSGQALSLDPVQDLGVALATAKAKLADLNAKYTEAFPEVVRTKREVADLEKRLAEARKHAASLAARDANADPLIAAAPLPGGAEIRSTHAQFKATVSEIASLARERAGILKSIASVERKIEQSPRREQEMISLIRDYENQKRSYDDLLKKKLDAAVSQNLEKRQKGSQFQILDPANLPEEPSQPNRRMIMGIALLLALALGFGGTIASEALDLRLRDVRDFRHLYKVPILGYIPVFQDQQYRRDREVRRAAVFGGLITFAMAFSILLIVYRDKILTILNH